MRAAGPTPGRDAPSCGLGALPGIRGIAGAARGLGRNGGTALAGPRSGEVGAFSGAASFRGLSSSRGVRLS